MPQLRAFPPSLLLLLFLLAACDGGGKKTPLEVEFQGSLIGTVQVEGSGVSGATVRLTGASFRETQTSATGAFSFSSLSAGSYTIQITGYSDDLEFPAESRSAVLTPATSSVRIDFLGSVKRDASIGGLVTLDGEGAEGLTVTVTGPEQGSASTDDQGIYELTGLKRGAYTVTLSGFDPNLHSFPVTVQSVSANGGGPGEVNFPGSLIPQPPSSPTGLLAAATGPYTAELGWTDTSEDETRYEVHRRTGADGDWAMIEALDPDETSFQDEGLEPNTTYGYRLRGCNDAGCSGFSEEASVTTDEVPPDAPTDLSATALGPFGVDLAWTDASDNESHFEVARDNGAQGEWAIIGTLDPDADSFTDSGLDPNTTYAYRVRACNEAGCSPWTDQATAITDEVPPEAPSNLVASGLGSSAVRLSWTDGSENETLFEIQRDQGGGGTWSSAGTTGPDGTTFDDTGLTPNTLYVYRVRACNDAGCSEWTQEAEASTDEVPPEAPSGLDADATGPESVDLEWTDEATNEILFEVQRRRGVSGTWAKVAETDANTTTLSDDGLSPGTQYRYRVRACNDVGCSGYSNEASARTDDVPPEAPTGLSATANGTTEVELSWSDGSSNEDGFRVERKTGAGGSFSLTATVGPNTTSFTDDGLDPGTTYSYRVSAFNEAGESPPSNEASATTDLPSGLNLTVAKLYLTQSTQTLDGEVPLVADRDGFLRVFAVASETNTSQPDVRVEFYLGGSLVHTEAIPSPGTSVPTAVQESSLNSSWNVEVPSSLIQPGLRILAEVDPDDEVAESSEGDNAFPSGGSPLAMDVRSTSTFNVTFVPVRQSVNGLVGNVSSGNAADFLDVTLQMLPVASANAQIHAEYVTGQPVLESDNGNGAWSGILSEINSLRVAEGTSRYYYGVVRTDYGSGVAGMGYLGWPTAIGWDHLPSGSGVAAHEWGHNWDLAHAPGCGAANPDPAFPYADGKIGVWGLDVSTTVAKSPSTFYDFMSYCTPDWISDYHYEKILEYRETWGSLGSPPQPEPSLLVWGRVEDGRLILEPAFEVTAPPVLPDGSGPYLLEGIESNGKPIYSGVFRPIPVPDAPSGEGHFAFAIPLRFLNQGTLAGIRVSGGGMTPSVREPQVGPRMAAGAEPRVTLRSSLEAEITWDAATYPMVMIRDPGTGEILSFARGGRTILPVVTEEIEMVFSNGLRSPEKIRRTVR